MRVFAKNMMTRWPVLLLPALLAFEALAYAQDQGPATPPPPNAPVKAQPAFSQPELDQMLAPIALYPDPLLSQILMASTYPLEVVEAARWSRANPNLKGDDAVRAIQQRDWDPSVKSLVAFPRILQTMDENLDWTERLGDAFLAQETQVMATAQNLRQKAYAAGNLRSNDEVRVEQEGQNIIVEPASPEVVYVPYYDPTVVYGAWWWTDYPPIYWAPWPGYFVESGFAWGIGIGITAGFFFGDCDWRYRRVNVANVNNYYYNRNLQDGRNTMRNVNTSPGVWQHNPDHRRGVPYRDATLRREYGRTSAFPESGRNFRGYDQPSLNQPSFRDRGSPGVSPSTGPAQHRPENQIRPENQPRSEIQPHPEAGAGSENRQYERGSPAFQSEPRAFSPPANEVRPPALEDIGRGQAVRSYSARGFSSYGGTARTPTVNPGTRHFNNSPGGFVGGGGGGGGVRHSR